MGEQETLKEGRRSTRISLSIPVEVSGPDAEGRQVREQTFTNLVNKHGGRMALQSRFSIGSEIMVSIPHLERQQRCKVTWVSGGAGNGGVYQTGVELERAENFWGIYFPPEDWVTPKPVRSAGNPPDRLRYQSSRSELEQQRLNVMLNALISVLEEKGILSRAELADRLKRMR